MDYDPDEDTLIYSNLQDSPKDIGQTGIRAEEPAVVIKEDGYFIINTGLLKNVSKHIGLEGVDLRERVEDDYLPELNEKVINSNRHRQCHILPENMVGLRLTLKLLFEIHSVEVRLYDGLDFDFALKGGPVPPRFN